MQQEGLSILGQCKKSIMPVKTGYSASCFLRFCIVII